MNLNNVFLFVKTGVTNVTFEWFLSIVNWSNVFSQTALVRRAVITSSHLNVLFSSWAGSMCIFKLPFWENSGHKCHIWVVSLLDEFLSYAFSNFSEGKFFGWIKVFKIFLPFRITKNMSLWIALYRKFLSQISHLNDLLELWTEDLVQEIVFTKNISLYDPG